MEKYSKKRPHYAVWEKNVMQCERSALRASARELCAPASETQSMLLVVQLLINITQSYGEGFNINTHIVI
jgi:hypothetical protein